MASNPLLHPGSPEAVRAVMGSLRVLQHPGGSSLCKIRYTVIRSGTPLAHVTASRRSIEKPWTVRYEVLWGTPALLKASEHGEDACLAMAVYSFIDVQTNGLINAAAVARDEAEGAE